MLHAHFAQVCTPDNSYTEVGIYPEIMPEGIVGQPYSQVLDFVLPTDTMGLDFTNFLILSVSLPVGLEWECSNLANGCNYNPQVSVNGCGLVYGTPLLSGEYLVDVNVIADLTAVQGVPFSFQIPLTILPFELGNSNDGFAMTGAFGCAPVMVAFTNNNPGLAAYSWDFGNGNSSSIENPGPQMYMNPGEYIVNYTAFASMDTIDVYTLSSVSVNSLSEYGGGFPGFDSPDPYFIIKENNQPIYQSSIVDGASFPTNWDLSITLNPTNIYTIEVWEADESNGEIWFGADDDMGQTTLNLNGCNGCVLTGGSGGGNISYTVTNQTILPNPAVISSDTVIVLGFPEVPVINYDEDQNMMSTEDLGYVYQWYFNGNPITNASNSVHTPTESGEYTVAAFNSGGCFSTSAPVTGIVCTDYQPGIYSTSTEIVLNNPMPNGTNQWYFNGNPISGATGNTTEITGIGSYSVTVTDDFGCEYPSTSVTFVVGIEQHSTPTWSVYPNPAEHKMNIQIQNNFVAKRIVISDMTGRIVRTLSTNKTQITVDIHDWPSGVYFVQLVGEHTTHTKKLVKK
jgi:phenylpyruvate tautomerase PptA (4-oxalocrotonate tautomerase family)